MAKLVLTVALVVLLAHASSAYRTTITTVEVEDSTKYTRESCRLKAQRMDLSACEQFIRPSRYGVLALEPEENPMDQKMRMCCDQLNEMGDQCQCEAVKYVMQKQMEQEQGQEKMQKMRKRATQIPMSCGISRCQMPSAFF